MKKIILSSALITFTLIACKTAEKTTTTPTPAPPAPPAVMMDCTKKVITYADIKPIMEQYCVRCHGDAGGYDLTQLADVKAAANKGDLLGTVKHLKGFPGMPDNEPMMPQPIIDQIECWINTGMK